MADLIIRIGAKSKEFSDELDKVKTETKQLESQLATIAKVSGAAFAGLTAIIGGSIATFREQEQAQFRTAQVIKSTGGAAGLTAKEIFKMASEMQNLTTFGDEAIISGANLLLTFKNIGRDTFPRATQAILDMATSMDIDLKSASIQVGKALNDPITGLSMLTRVGITFTDQQKNQIKALQNSGQAAKAQSIILKELESQFGGSAAAATQGTGAFIQLKNSFGDLVEVVGGQFVPILAPLAKGLTATIDTFKENPVIAKTAAVVLGLGASFAGLATALSLGSLAFLKIRAAMIAANLTTKVLSLSIKGLVGATGLGLLLIVANEIFENWSTIWPAIEKAFTAVAKNIGNVAKALGDILSAAFTLDLEGVKQGYADLKAASVKGVNEVIDAVQGEIDKPENKIDITPSEDAGGGENDIARKFRESEEAKTKAKQDEMQKRIMLAKAELEASKNADDESLQKKVEFIQREQELDKQAKEAQGIVNDELRATELEKVKVQQEELLQDKVEFAEKRREIEAEIREQDKELNLELQDLDKEQRALLSEEKLNQIRDEVKTKRQIDKDFTEEKLKRDVKSRNLFLKDEKKHGTTIAHLNQNLNRQEVQGAFAAANQLTQLQQSKSKKQQAIGKAAGRIRIAQQTAIGAISAYQSLSGIPLVGPVLGAAAAAALVSYGLEQQQNLGANRGGVVPLNLGVRGQDSVPSMLTPGELVAPDKNFDEVVEGVARQRGFTKEGEGETSSGDEQASGVTTRIEITGDAVVDNPTFVDNLIERIREKVEFDNADLGFEQTNA